MKINCTNYSENWNNQLTKAVGNLVRIHSEFRNSNYISCIENTNNHDFITLIVKTNMYSSYFGYLNGKFWIPILE